MVSVLRFCAGLHPSGGGTKHIETVQTAATASKVYIQKKSEEITIKNVYDLGTLIGFDM